MSVAEKALEIYESLTDFEKRDSQREMVRFMAECIDSGENGALEAPTGTGKSLAVLVTAYAAWKELGYSSIISTNTHVLQSQMAEKDFFLFKKALPEKTDFIVKSVMGKGRYICRRKKEEIRDMINKKGPLIISDKEATVIDAVRLESLGSDDLLGERKWIDSAIMREDDPLSFVLSCEGCIKRACPYYIKGCVYYRAILFKSDVTVTNHSLVKSLMGTLKADLFFFDEAHHLMGYSTSPKYTRYLERPVRLVYAPLPEFYKDLIKERELFVKRMSLLYDKFFYYLSIYSYGMAITILREMRRVISSRMQKIKAIPDEEVAAVLKAELYKIAEHYDTARNIYNDAITGKDVVVTPEFAGTRELPDAPRSFTQDLKENNKDLKSCLFLSSTITVDGSYSAFRTKTGAEFREGPIIPSELPWHKTVLWAPKVIPSPKSDKFTDMFAAFCARYIPPFVEKDLGGVLVLCTSLERMRACANALGSVMKDHLLVQGQLPKRETMRRFLHERSSVLVSSNSFREGFDAPGDRLTWLILDRLPFGPMEDEENDTAIRLLAKWGKLKNPFDYRLDMMKLALRQGIGRLIRSRKDYGAVTIFDSRFIKNEKWNINTPIKNVVTDFFTPEEWVKYFQEKFLL